MKLKKESIEFPTASTEANKAGRNETAATEILESFTTKKLKLAKLECVRAKTIRKAKKLLRFLLKSKRSSEALIMFVCEDERFSFCCPALVQFVLNNRDYLTSSNAGGTESDPARTGRSFDADYMREYFSNGRMNHLHDLMIASIFETLSPEDILGLKIKDNYNTDHARNMIKLLLLSPYFKGEPNSEETLRQQIEDLGPAQVIRFADSDYFDFLLPIYYPNSSIS
jgi:hypothetical protein